eukprot:gnl/Dysnectes_brevis/2321_a2736_1759.p1 GENE.gnl/Dysnectes_brevis/2321_a2736_1759~~gnl/Dysnectes_brevis/2321_a2736_1759.p1  ORF type:complete len:348 (+),score=77.24 gnl/Dysnectes_brevis/2321_a2736_1759:118-1044(+)
MAIEKNSIPHLLFYGPPGVGKTSAILAMARDLFGPKLWRERVKELNASDDRGISVVRNQVKTFARLKATKKAKGYPCPPLKLIVLDEADAMTKDAQAALRRVMEDHAASTRMCLICNYPSKIIAPISSRCTKLRFHPLPADTVHSALRDVAAKEGRTDISEEVLAALGESSEGDLRRAVTLLQSTITLSGDEPPQADDVQEISGDVPLSYVRAMVSRIVDIDYTQAGVAEIPQALAQQIVWDAYAAEPFLRRAWQVIKCDVRLSDVVKVACATRLSKASRSLTAGVCEKLVLIDFFNSFLISMVQSQQ